MFDIDDKDIKRLESDLKVFAERSFPFATKQTVNSSAFAARKIWQDNIREKMITRNRFTVQSIRVEQTKTLNVRRQAATVGSTADYMEDQEFGGIKTNPTIATSYSAGQGESTQPRTRMPRKANKMSNVRLSKRRKLGMTRKQRNFLTVREAATSGRKYLFLDLGKRKGIFKLTGGKRRPKIKMIHNTGIQSVTIPRTPTMKPAVEAVPVPEIYKKALLFQVKRQGLFK